MSDQSRPNMNGIIKTFLYSRLPPQDLYHVAKPSGLVEIALSAIGCALSRRELRCQWAICVFDVTWHLETMFNTIRLESAQTTSTQATMPNLSAEAALNRKFRKNFALCLVYFDLILNKGVNSTWYELHWPLGAIPWGRRQVTIGRSCVEPFMKEADSTAILYIYTVHCSFWPLK